MVDIIIPAWNEPEMTNLCLQAVAAHTGPRHRVILVDNGSEEKARDSTLTELARLKFDFFQIRFKENLGFAKAVNEGLRHSKAEFVVLLNNDVEVTAAWLDKLLAVANRWRRIGVAGVLTDSGKIQNYQRFHGAIADPFRTINMMKIGPVDVSGCVPFSCALLRWEMIDKIGDLDEDFSPCLGEDDDYCDRARLAGWRTVLLLNTLVHHRHRVSVSKIPNLRDIKTRAAALLEQKRAARRRLRA